MNHEPLGLKIVFGGVSARDASSGAAELRTMLLDRVDDELTASLERDNPDSLDGGSTLVLLFGAPGAVALAAGIRAFLAKRPAHRDTIVIRTAEGDEVIAAGEAASKLDAPALIEALQRRRANR